MALSKKEFEELRAEFHRVIEESNRNPYQYHVMPYRRRWLVRSREEPPFRRFFRSKEVAVELARELAFKTRGELIIHSWDGDVEEVVSFKSDPSGEARQPIKIQVKLDGTRGR
jgi:hypothetical protein